MDILQNQIKKLETQLADLNAEKASKETDVRNVLIKIQQRKKNGQPGAFEKAEWARLKASIKDIDREMKNVSGQIRALQTQLTQAKQLQTRPLTLPPPTSVSPSPSKDIIDEKYREIEQQMENEGLLDSPSQKDKANIGDEDVADEYENIVKNIKSQDQPQFSYGPEPENDDFSEPTLEAQNREQEKQMVKELEEKYGSELTNKGEEPQMPPLKTRASSRRNRRKKQKLIKDTEKTKTLKREPVCLLRQPLMPLSASEERPIKPDVKDFAGLRPSVSSVSSTPISSTPISSTKDDENEYEDEDEVKNDKKEIEMKIMSSPSKQPQTQTQPQPQTQTQNKNSFRDSLRPASQNFKINPNGAQKKLICPAILKTGKNVTKKFFFPSQFPNLTKLRPALQSKMSGGRKPRETRKLRKTRKIR